MHYMNVMSCMMYRHELNFACLVSVSEIARFGVLVLLLLLLILCILLLLVLVVLFIRILLVILGISTVVLSTVLLRCILLLLLRHIFLPRCILLRLKVWRAFPNRLFRRPVVIICGTSLLVPMFFPC